jgi:hypothetical protein
MFGPACPACRTENPWPGKRILSACTHRSATGPQVRTRISSPRLHRLGIVVDRLDDPNTSSGQTAVADRPSGGARVIRALVVLAVASTAVGSAIEGGIAMALPCAVGAIFGFALIGTGYLVHVLRRDGMWLVRYPQPQIKQLAAVPTPKVIAVSHRAIESPRRAIEAPAVTCTAPARQGRVIHVITDAPER